LERDMRFTIQVNEATDDGSVTLHRFETGSNIARTNRKYLRQYLGNMGVPVYHQKMVLKMMKLWYHVGRS
jgi:hypothetical protein